MLPSGYVSQRTLLAGLSGYILTSKKLRHEPMKFIKKLVGKEDEKTPTWDIKPPSQRPAPRKRVEADAPPVAKQKKEKNPFLDDNALDAMTLEPDAIPEDNPYKTPNWEEDLENDTRKLKAIAIDDIPEDPVDDKFNPYATGTLKRGWKK